jgi:hypothetical protein
MAAQNKKEGEIMRLTLLEEARQITFLRSKWIEIDLTRRPIPILGMR